MFDIFSYQAHDASNFLISFIFYEEIRPMNSEMKQGGMRYNTKYELLVTSDRHMVN